MPAFPHEILVDIFRNGGDVVRELLRTCAEIKLGKVTAETASIDLSQVVPIEYRADNVTVFRAASASRSSPSWSRSSAGSMRTSATAGRST